MFKLKKTIIALCGVMLMNVNTAYGAGFETINPQNIECLQNIPEDARNIINLTVNELPEKVILFHKQKGGNVFLFNQFPKDNFYFRYMDPSNIIGMYIDGSHNIYASYNPEIIHFNATYTVLDHEYGHFVYHMTKKYWDQNDNKKMNELYKLLSPVDENCYNESETFAVAYSYWKYFNAMNKAGIKYDTAVAYYKDPVFFETYEDFFKKCEELIYDLYHYQDIKESAAATGPAMEIT